MWALVGVVSSIFGNHVHFDCDWPLEAANYAALAGLTVERAARAVIHKHFKLEALSALVARDFKE